MFKYLSILCTCTLISISVISQPTQRSSEAPELKKASKHIIQADEDVKSGKFGKALKRYERILDNETENKHAMIGISYSCLVLGMNEKSNHLKQKYFKRSRSFAEKAFQFSSMSVDANFMMALVLEKMAEIEHGDRRVSLLKDVWNHANYALRFERDNPGVYYLLGKAHYLIVSSPDYFVQAGDEFPNGASMELAIKYLSEAVKMAPHRLLYRYDLAKALEEDLRTTEALEVINGALELGPRIEDGGEKLYMLCQEMKFTLN